MADFFPGGHSATFHKQSEQAGREQVNKSPDIRNVKVKAEYQSFKPPNISLRNPASLKL